MVFRDREFLLQFIAEVRGVDHDCMFVDGIRKFFRRIGKHEFRPGEADRTIKRAAPARHDHFILEAGGIGKLPDVLVIGARHASCGCDRHGASCTGGDHALVTRRR